MTTPRLSLAEITQGQGDKYATHNEGLRGLDALLPGTCISAVDNTPPGAPANGDVYIVAQGSPSATGDWAGQEGNIAWYNSAWNFVTPAEGMVFYAQDDDTEYRYDGSSWNAVPSENIDTFTELTDTPSNYTLQEYKGTRVNSAGTALEFYDTEALRAISTTYSSLNIVASGIYAVGDWRKEVHASYMDETVPSGNYIGAHASESAATTAGGTGGDWYYDTGDQNFYELLSGSPSRQQIYRAGSANMPALIGVVATATRVIIFDMTKDVPEMWMELSGTSSSDFLLTPTNITCVAFAGSRLHIGADTSDKGLFVVDFADDVLYRHTATAGTDGTYRGSIAERDSDKGYDGVNVSNIVADDVNALATYLSGSGATNGAGVEIPYVLVGTDGGVSQIDPDGTVYDLTSQSANDDVSSVAFNEQGPDLLFAWGDGTAFTRSMGVHDGLLAADKDAATYRANTGVTGTFNTGNGANECLPACSLTSSADDGLIVGTNTDNEWVFATTEALVPYLFNASTPLESLAAYILNDSTTGWMKGDIKGAWGGDTDTSSLVGGSPSVFLTDHSGNGNDLEVFGTLTRSAVATGAELTEISGFSASNYLQSAAGMDGIDSGSPGGDDFCFCFWVTSIASSTDSQTPFSRNGDTGGSTRIQVSKIESDDGTNPNEWWFKVGNDVSFSGDTSTGDLFIVAQRSSGTAQLYINGVLVDSFAASGDLSDTNTVVYWGQNHAQTQEITGALSLMRFSNTALTQADIDRIYLDEKKLFQANANCTLDGSSDAVLSLAYDKKRNRTHAATSDGTSVFSGLNRVDELTSDDAISAHDGASIGNASGATQIDKPAISMRELLAELRG